MEWIELGTQEWAGKAERGAVSAVLRRRNTGWMLEITDQYWNLYGSPVMPESEKVTQVLLSEALTVESISEAIRKATGISFSGEKLAEKLNILKGRK